MRLCLISICMAILLLVGCKPYENLQTFEDGGEACPATIEGTLTETPKWIGDVPLLVTKGVGRNFEYRTGEILELTEEELLFDEDRRSVANNPAPRHYPVRQIYSLIDENGSIVAGEFPDEDYGTKHYILSIQEVGSDGKPEGIIMEPDKKFSFCAKPGEYQLTSVLWKRNNGDTDVVADYIDFSTVFTVQDQTANYIGSIYANFDEDIEQAKRHGYPMKVHSRPQNTAGMIIGFGLTGAVIDEISREKGIVSFINFQVYENPDFQSMSGYPIQFTEVQ